MSTSLVVAGKQVAIYCGISVLILGVIGALLNTLVFRSLQTFRQSSCAFYLTIMSIGSIGHLFFGLFPRIQNGLIDVDATETSLFYCKFRPFITQTCLGAALTCFCLATIDQYFATCSCPRWQQFCNIKLAQRLVIASVLFWILQGILLLVYFDHIQSPTTNKVTCTNSNPIFSVYLGYFIVLVIEGYLPITITALFGLLAYRNVQQIAYRTVPLIRRELDKQITRMVLLQVLIGIFGLLPYTTVYAITTNTNLANDPVIQANLQFASTVTVNIGYLYFGSPFYIYICASDRFRRQFIYVLSKMHPNQWKRPRMDVNQVIPET